MPRKKSKCCPGPIPTPLPGYQMKLLEDCCTVEYTYVTPTGEKFTGWYWDMKKREWIVPPGHPDPNPVTPTGVPLGGPGTF